MGSELTLSRFGHGRFAWIDRVGMAVITVRAVMLCEHTSVDGRYHCSGMDALWKRMESEWSLSRFRHGLCGNGPGRGDVITVRACGRGCGALQVSKLLKKLCAKTLEGL